MMLFFLIMKWYLSFRLVWYRRIIFLQNTGDRNIAILLFNNNFWKKNHLNHQAFERLICHGCSIGFCDKDRHGGITPVSPISGAAVNLSLCYLWGRYITWGPGSLGHARMYGADSRAACHPSELINVEQGLVFLICLIWAGQEAMALVEPPLVLSDGLTCAFLFSLPDSKMETSKRSHPLYMPSQPSEEYLWTEVCCFSSYHPIINSWSVVLPGLA